jgi:hypothetical protein
MVKSFAFLCAFGAKLETYLRLYNSPELAEATR